ncbi:MAG: SCO family protein [Oligoflexia bacterium]|nr:SCO family protein [Oligoflexia bacterium]
MKSSFSLYLIATFFALLTLHSGTNAQADFGSKGHLGKTENTLPEEFKEVGIDEHRGEFLGLKAEFNDDKGQAVTLEKYFNKGKPVLLSLVYFGCPNICTFVLNGVVDSLKKINLNPGKDFEVVVISIDPNEKPDLASEKKINYLEAFGKPETAQGWHFLTGSDTHIKSVASQIGFRYKWDEKSKQFAHGSAVFVLTPNGQISRYLYGIQYAPQDMKLALLEAGQGKIGSFVDRIILFCFYYDTATKKYVLLADRLMTGVAAGTAIILAIFLGNFWLRERRKSLSAQHRS